MIRNHLIELQRNLLFKAWYIFDQLANFCWHHSITKYEWVNKSHLAECDVCRAAYEKEQN